MTAAKVSSDWGLGELVLTKTSGLIRLRRIGGLTTVLVSVGAVVTGLGLIGDRSKPKRLSLPSTALRVQPNIRAMASPVLPLCQAYFICSSLESVQNKIVVLQDS